MARRGVLGGGISRRERALLAQHQDRARSGGVNSQLERLRDEPRLAVSVLIESVAHRDNSRGGWDANAIAEQLLRWKLPYDADDAQLLVALVETDRGPSWFRRTGARVALAALESRAGAGDDVSALADRLLNEVVKPHDAEASEWTKLAARLRKLTRTSGGKLDLSVLRADDPWTEHVRPLVAARFAEQGQLLEQLATATQSKPSRRWLTTVGPLLSDDGGALLQLLIESTLAVKSRQTGTFVLDGQHYGTYVWLSDPSATIIRGALWAASLLTDAEWVAPACERLLARARQEEQLKVGNAAFYCLGERADDPAVTVLGRAVTQIKDRRFLKPALRALETAAGKRGVSSEQLREQLVPTFGLDADGRMERVVGPATAFIELVPPAQVKTRFVLGGKETAGAPQALKDGHADELAASKAAVTELRKELGLQRQRLENLLADERVWPYADWQEHYLEHPLVQLFTRRLIWRFDDQPAIPLASDEFLTVDGPISPPSCAEVRLWHPVVATTEQITGWRALLRDRELRQPFKQAYREIYLVAPAERETQSYSNRFAAHIVRYPQVYALAKQRGWGVRALGWFDNDGGEQWRDFPEHKIRASFWMELADNEMGAAAIADLAATDQVRFTRTGDHDPLPIDDVPTIVFSEAMRDVDLFVGVASIAADPTWIDGGADRFRAYWHENAFSELGESAKLRREVLTALLPGLKVRDQLELEDRYLRVRGKLHSYRIHLGSANILIEPHDRYLCIVPDRRPAIGNLFLPFEDDRLAVILSKALMLAADDRITDPTITQQLR